MKSIAGLAILLLSTFSICYGQSVFDDIDTIKYPYHKWNNLDIKACNTARHSYYMSKEERNTIWIINLARFDGALFAQTFFREYLEKDDLEHTIYVRTLYKDLNRTHEQGLLKPDKKLFRLAKSHAVWSGKEGSTGHQNFDKRADKARSSLFSECCDYGNEKGLDIVMSLLIDEDVPSLGHRKNLLDKNIKYIGISIQPHSYYSFNCVIDCAD